MNNFRALPIFLLTAFAANAVDDAPRAIPLKPDPPFAVDGDLDEWSDVPGAMAYNAPEQAVWGAQNRRDSADFSGKVWAAWRNEHLYIAADVTDDRLAQGQRGSMLWKGDHVEVYVDSAPDLDPNRDVFGDGQFQLGLSPGNFKNTGDPLVDSVPEAFCFHPTGGSIEGVLVAAQQTDSGWALEAAIPWALLGIEKPAVGTPLRLELGLSDTDVDEPQQEVLMTSSTEAWGRSRSRLPLAVLSPADGVAPPLAQATPIFDVARVAQGESATFVFTSPATPEGRDAILTLQARLDTERVAGHTPALKLTLNGTALDAERLRNKPLRAKARSGNVYSMAAGERFTTYYAPDFDSPDNDSHYGLTDGLSACAFELDVTDALIEGQNTLLVENAAEPSVDRTLVAADGRLLFRMPPPPPREKAGPPAGPLPVFEPRASHKTEYSVEEPAPGQLRVHVGDTTYTITSRFSTPRPEWVQGSNEFFDLSRRIEQEDEWVIVHDTFTNLTDQNLALMHRHEIDLGDAQKRVWLAGLEQLAAAGSFSTPANPTSFVAAGTTGAGLVALDDVFRVHVTNYAAAGMVGVADNALVLPPGKTCTAEWAIVPADAPDYWTFLNAARRLVNANFTIPGGFAFLRNGPIVEEWSDELVANFLRFKDPYYVCAGISYPRYKGRYPHGTAFQQIAHDSYISAFRRWRALYPDAKYQVYFHCFLDVTDEAPEVYADARLLRPDGEQANYGEETLRLFIPTDQNNYGPAVRKNVDVILDTIGADGVYWDEHEYSRWAYHYGEPWDGCSGDIDPKAMTVSRLKSSVTLLSEAWRVQLAQDILARGPLVGNGVPITGRMAALDFPCFVETGSITNCARAHMYSPIALGDHLTERSEEDAYGVMLAALDYGCVYHWYNDVLVIPTHPHLTRYMYPITPVEMHEGYIIGEERIITNRSGLFGWGDASEHEVHVFDDTGCEVEGFTAPQVARDGKTCTELRIAEDWSAAIVRRQ